MMNQLTRRDFQQQAIGSLLTWSLLETLFKRDAFAQLVKPIAAKWLAAVFGNASRFAGNRG